jgi:hypothetical protein
VAVQEHYRAGPTTSGAGHTGNPPPPATYEEEQIEIPGTHVPPWVVIVLVVGVMAVLLGTALVLR